MLASKLIHYFSSHPAAFGFQASTPPNYITLNSANRKADQSISDFQTGVGVTAHATLDMEQLTSWLWVALVDTLSSLPKAEGGVIPVSEVHELLLRIHDILDKAVSMQVGNSAHILEHMFIYIYYIWSLVQAHSVGLSQSFTPKRVGKARPWNGFHFTVQKRPMSGFVPGTSGASLPKRPHLESGNKVHPSGKKTAGGSVSPSSAETRRKGGMGVSIPDVPESSASSASSSSTSATFQVGMFFKFFDQCRSITSNRTVLNMVWGHHLPLWSHPPLFHDF